MERLMIAPSQVQQEPLESATAAELPRPRITPEQLTADMMLDQHTFWLEILGTCINGWEVDTKRLQEMFWHTARSRVQQMIPRVRIPWS